MNRDQRKNYLWGMTPVELIGMIVFVLGMTATTVLYAASVRNNTQGIAENKKAISEVIPKQMAELKNEVLAEIQKSDVKQSKRMDRMENRIGGALRDLQNAVMKGNARR